MSTHLSASQRTILAMQRRIAELEQMQKEYNAFLNYIVFYHGDAPYCEGTREEIENNRVFIVHSDKIKSLNLLSIKSEIVDNGARMELRRVDNKNNGGIITLPS